MRVLMTTDAIGGVWSYTLELCRALHAHRVQISLAVLGARPSDSQRLQAVSLPNVTLHESVFRLEWMPDPWEDLNRAAEWLLELESQLAPDIVHLNHLVHADLPWTSPVMTVAHSCVLSWWAATHGEPAPASWSIYKDRVAQSLRAAACVVAPTEAALREFECLYGPFRRSVVVLNARDWRRFSAGRKQPMVLAAGRVWDRAKNIEALAAVAPQLPLPVCVAGATAGPGGENTQFSGLHILGPLDPAELAKWYSRAAIYALPARYEPFGLTALEAAMSGCALVLGDIASLHEVWGPAARYVPPEDHECLRDTLSELAANDSLRGHFAARAMARARHFTPARQARQYIGLYQEMLGSGRAGRSGYPQPG
jgi:glycogen(starch) synthase